MLLYQDFFVYDNNNRIGIDQIKMYSLGLLESWNTLLQVQQNVVPHLQHITLKTHQSIILK